MISREEILKGQLCPPELEENLQALLTALNKFRDLYATPMIVTSGYRTADHNQSVGGRPQSAHLTCQAADFLDSDRSLRDYCLANLSVLEDCSLYMEDPSYTPNWVHLQIRPTHNRVFIP